MFAFCALAYLLAWFIMKSLVPKYSRWFVSRDRERKDISEEHFHLFVVQLIAELANFHHFSTRYQSTSVYPASLVISAGHKHAAFCTDPFTWFGSKRCFHISISNSIFTIRKCTNTTFGYFELQIHLG